MLEITYNNKTEGRTSPQKHMSILKALGDAFDNTELTIYDNKNRKLSLAACRKMANLEHYESHFTIHQGNGRHYVIFRVLATVGFQSLKRQPAVLKTLKSTGCYMKRHHWGQDKWDIVTLGFILEIDPGRHMSDEVREQILDLANTKECLTIPGSRFKLVAQRFKLKSGGSICNADAYGIQCMRIDAHLVDTLLKTTYRETNTYVKNKLRKENPKAYCNALRIQNRYMTTVKTIILMGISRMTMKELRPRLLAEPEIDQVAATNKLDTLGRWDILTNEANYKKVTDTINQKLQGWLAAISMDEDHPPEFPTPGISTRPTHQREEDSSQGDISYLSSSAGSYDSIMADDTVQYNEVPMTRRKSVAVSGFSWAQVTARNPQAPSSQGTRSNVSEITSPTASQPTESREITDLRQEVKGLAEQVQQLLAILLIQKDTPSSPSPAVHPQLYQGYGASTAIPQGMPPMGFHPQWHPPQWQPQQPQQRQPTHQQQPPLDEPPTPTRKNNSIDKSTGGAIPGATFLPKRIQDTTAINVDGSEPLPKRKDDKETPLKRQPAPSLQHHNHHPGREPLSYPQPQLPPQYHHAGMVTNYNRGNGVIHDVPPHYMYGHQQQDAQYYDHQPPYPQLRYPPPSPQRELQYGYQHQRGHQGHSEEAASNPPQL